MKIYKLSNSESGKHTHIVVTGQIPTDHESLETYLSCIVYDRPYDTYTEITDPVEIIKALDKLSEERVKYVAYDLENSSDNFILFSEQYNHLEMNEVVMRSVRIFTDIGLPILVLGAGFIANCGKYKVENGKYLWQGSCFGESYTLNVKSNGVRDTKLLTPQMSLEIIR